MPLTVACAWHVQRSLNPEHPAPSRSDTMEGDLHTAVFTHLFGTDGQTEVGLLINKNNNSIQVHTPICTRLRQGCCCLHTHVLETFTTDAISLALNKASIMQNCGSNLFGALSHDLYTHSCHQTYCSRQYLPSTVKAMLKINLQPLCFPAIVHV